MDPGSDWFCEGSELEDIYWLYFFFYFFCFVLYTVATKFDTS